MRASVRKIQKAGRPKSAEAANFELTDIDRRILKVMQEDGRMTIQAIGDHVGLSASPCLRRIRRMEQAGIITAYSITLDQKADLSARKAALQTLIDNRAPDLRQKRTASPQVSPRIAW